MSTQSCILLDLITGQVGRKIATIASLSHLSKFKIIKVAIDPRARNFHAPKKKNSIPRISFDFQSKMQTAVIINLPSSIFLARKYDTFGGTIGNVALSIISHANLIENFTASISSAERILRHICKFVVRPKPTFDFQAVAVVTLFSFTDESIST